MGYVLRSLQVEPPGGWRWKCPIYGASFTAFFFADLSKKVKGYLTANRIHTPKDFDAWLQDDLCRRNLWGPEICVASEVEPEGFVYGVKDPATMGPIVERDEEDKALVTK